MKKLLLIFLVAATATSASASWESFFDNQNRSSAKNAALAGMSAAAVFGIGYLAFFDRSIIIPTITGAAGLSIGYLAACRQALKEKQQELHESQSKLKEAQEKLDVIKDFSKNFNKAIFHLKQPVSLWSKRGVDKDFHIDKYRNYMTLIGFDLDLENIDSFKDANELPVIPLKYLNQ